MNQCLNREQTKELLEYAFSGITSIIADEMVASIRCSSTWHLKLICVNYLVAWIISGISNRDHDTAKAKIENLYKMKDTLYLSIEECNEEFIDYLLKSYPGIISDNLENEVFTIAKSFSEHESTRPLHS